MRPPNSSSLPAAPKAFARLFQQAMPMKRIASRVENGTYKPRIIRVKAE
jgi:hypothetical protein